MSRIFNDEKLYTPLPQQRKFHQSTAKYRLLGGACGGGKSWAVIWESILRCLHYEFPVTGAIFRRSFPELDSTIIRSTLEILPTWMYKYNQSQHVLTFPHNQSRIEYCYAESDKDVMRYQSREWDFVGIDELTHFSEYQFTYLLTRMRTKKPLKTKFFAATNPGNIGHKFVKDRWITKTCETEGYIPSEYEFIPAKIQDNPYLMKANPDYITNLKNLPDKERRALLDGDWDVFEGQFFTSFSQSRHVVDPFTVPDNWQLIMGWDDGTRAPRAVHVYAVDNDSRVWCVWEYYKAGETINIAAQNIREELKKLNIWDRVYKCVVDPSMSRKSSQSGISSIDVLEQMGFGFQIGQIETGNNDRTEGWRVMKSYLSHQPYEEPMLKFFSTCVNMIRTLPQMVYYETKTGDDKKDDLDSKTEDHCVTGDTLVSLPTGYARIDSLVGTTGEIYTLGGMQPYHSVRRTGREKVYKTRFSDGSCLNSTGDHGVLMSNYDWKSVLNLKIGDKVIDGRSKSVIQSGVYEPQSSKPYNPGVQRKQVLSLRCLFSTGWDKVTQSRLGSPVWKNPDWLSYTSRGQEPSEQQYRKPDNAHPRISPFVSWKEYQRTNKEKTTRPPSENQKTNEKMARLERRTSMAQQTRQGKLERQKENTENMPTMWQNLLDQIERYISVLSSKLQSQSTTKTVENVEYIGYKDVYNMDVDHTRCFLLRNGIIIHNCVDAARYVLMSLERLPSRFTHGKSIKIVNKAYIPKSTI